MNRYILLFLLAATQVAFAQEKRIEGAFGVLFNTDLAAVIGGLEGRTSQVHKNLAKRLNLSLTHYAITPPQPQRHLRGYTVDLNKKTQKIYKICGAANIDFADTEPYGSISISQDEALSLYEAYDKALTNKYGEGELGQAEHPDFKTKRFAESITQFISLDYSWLQTELTSLNHFEIDLCYVDRVIRGDKIRYRTLPSIIEVDESSL